MQFSAELYIFIVKTYLNFIFTKDLKRKYFLFRKMFIVTDLVSLKTLSEEILTKIMTGNSTSILFVCFDV